MYILNNVPSWDKELKYLDTHEIGLRDFVEKHLISSSVGDQGKFGFDFESKITLEDSV